MEEQEHESESECEEVSLWCRNSSAQSSLLVHTKVKITIWVPGERPQQPRGRLCVAGEVSKRVHVAEVAASDWCCFRSLRLGCEVFVCSAGRSTAPLERLAEIQAIEEEDVLQRVVVGNRVKELSNCEQETEVFL